MFAQVGDRLVIRSHRVGEPPREAEVIELRHADGTPPYVVRWTDTGHEALVFPGSDAEIRGQHSESGSSGAPS
jgi:hypothetical protein